MRVKLISVLLFAVSSAIAEKPPTDYSFIRGACYPGGASGIRYRRRMKAVARFIRGY